MLVRKMMRVPPEMRQVLAKLRRIHNRPVTPPRNYAQVERQVHKVLAEAQYLGDDETIQEAIDAYVDSFVADLRAAVEARRRADLYELDELSIRVRPQVAAFKEFVRNDERKLEEMRLAVHGALHLLADDDMPKENPLRRRELS